MKLAVSFSLPAFGVLRPNRINGMPCNRCKRAGQAGEVLWMKVPHGEGVASHSGPESCGCTRKGAVEALTGVRAGWVLSPKRLRTREAETVCTSRRQHPGRSPARERPGSRGAEDPTHARKHLTREDHPLVRKPGGPRLGQPVVPARMVRVMNP